MNNSFTEEDGVSLSELLRIAFLFLIPVALYLKSGWFDFLYTWDDANYVVNNPLIHALSRDNLAAIFTTETMGNYAPLHLLTYALEYQWWGSSPAGYHLANVLVHAVNACCAYLVVRNIMHDKRVAFAAALLFGVHAVNVENVAWISESKTLFASFFSFLSILCYLKFRQRGPLRWYVLAVFCFLTGILFKASIVTLPFVLLAYDLLIRRKKIVWPETLPFAAISLAGVLLAVWAQVQGGAVEREGLTAGFLFGTAYPTMVPVLWKYVGLFLVPVNLCGYYDTTLYHSFLDVAVLLPLAAGILVLVLVFWKGNGQVRFWFLWSSVFFLPVSNAVPLPVYYADRYVYAPALGACVLLVLAVQSLARRAGAYGKLSWAVLMVLVLTYSVAAFSRLDVWRNELVFWEDTVSKSPGLYKPHLNLGAVYEKAGRLSEAEHEYLVSLSVRQTPEARYNLGMVRARMEYRKQQKP